MACTAIINISMELRAFFVTIKFENYVKAVS